MSNRSTPPANIPAAQRATPLAAVAATLLASCAALVSGPRGPSSTEVDRAFQAADHAQLVAWCENGRANAAEWSKSSRHDEDRANSRAACDRADELNRRGEAQSFTAALTCDNAATSFAALDQPGTRPDERDLQEAFYAAGTKLAACGHLDTLLREHLARAVAPVSTEPTSRHGFRLLAQLAADGVDIAGTLEGFGRAADYRFAGARYTADAVVTFLLQQGNDHCSAHVSALTSDNQEVLLRFMEYFGQRRCKEAVPGLAKLLDADVPVLRAAACTTLGKIGDARPKSKVKAMAKLDPASVTNGLVVQYPVRDACAGALVRL